MNPTTFRAIKNDQDNLRWQSLFNSFWPSYKQWYQSKQQDKINSRELQRGQKALKLFMPEIVPVYEQLCERVNDDPIAMQFLTLFEPPAYLINCSQAVFFDEQPILIRNYDLSPDLSENTVFHSSWLGRNIISTNECLWGADDGLNDAGLALSLTFGGSREVGSGFGIPLIMRYVLQTCDTVRQAIEQLNRIPSHMAYNITLVDQSGDYATVMLAPQQQAVVTRQAAVTNHQQKIVWPEQAEFSRTLERSDHLNTVLNKKGFNEQQLVDTFHRSPLYSTNYEQRFGTVFTAVYKPLSGSMAYHWPNQIWPHSFEQFNESQKTVTLGQLPNKSTDEKYSNVTDQQDFIPQSVLPVETSDDALIPRQTMSQLDSIFSYLPEQFVKNKSTYNKLKSDLTAGHEMSWTQFTTSMQQMWI